MVYVVPIGSPECVEDVVKEKTKTIVEDVKQLQLLTDDPSVHFKLIRFCHDTRLAHLNRNGEESVPNGHGDAGLRRANSGLCRGQRSPVQGPRHQLSIAEPGGDEVAPHVGGTNCPTTWGGMGLTPQHDSGIAAFYSASSTFVGWLAQRPHRCHWLRLGRRLQDHGTWTASTLVDVKHTQARLIDE